MRGRVHLILSVLILGALWSAVYFSGSLTSTHDRAQASGKESDALKKGGSRNNVSNLSVVSGEAKTNTGKNRASSRSNEVDLPWPEADPAPTELEKSGFLAEYYQRWKENREDRHNTRLFGSGMEKKFSEKGISPSQVFLSCGLDLCRLKLTFQDIRDMALLNKLEPNKEIAFVVGKPEYLEEGPTLVIYGYR
ncbi:MAG: hypothetical protein JXA30_20255 [Deltaproteobacteria bacterium]|nr:hypothetical protein [Deltaproteobacteria bacterium]